MEGRMIKFYPIRKADDGSFKIGWAFHGDEIKMHGSMKVDQDHEYYSLVDWISQNPPEFAPIFSQDLADKINEVFQEQTDPTWDSLMRGVSEANKSK